MSTSRTRSRNPKVPELRRWLAAALLASAGVGARAGVLAAEEPVVPETYRRASEALQGALFPGARRDWDNGDLIWPDGRQQKLSLTGLTWAPRDGGWWVLAGIEFPDAFEEQARRLHALERPTERQSARVVIARTNAEFVILEHRVFEPDPESPLSKLVTLTFLRFPTGPGVDGGWPRLRVRGVSGALMAGGAGLVWWDGEFDVTSMSWWMRGPSELWRKEGDGSEAREMVGAAPVGAAPVDAAPAQRTAQPRALGSGSPLSSECTPPCDIRPYATLEAAASRAKPAPAKPPGP